MKQIYTNMDQLPIMLNADQVAQVLGISRAGAYQLMHSKDFPTLRIGKRMVVPKEMLSKWLEEKLKSKEAEEWQW
jgi:excisionase family DNA binding protein